MTSAYRLRLFPSRRPHRLATPGGATAVIELERVSAGAPSGRDRAGLAAMILMVVLIHGVLWKLVHPASDEVLQPPLPVPVEITLARPLPIAQAAPEARAAAPAAVPPRAVRPQPARPSAPHASAAVAPGAEAAIAPAVDSEPSREPAAPVVAPSEPAPAETAATGQLGYLNNPPPVYPESALERGLEGVVRLKVFVLASGRPASVELDQSSGSRALDEAALRAVRRWMFVPATRAGQAVDGWASVPVVFKLGK